MLKTKNRGNKDFSRFDKMGDEELEEILRLDAQNITGAETDTEMLLYVMEVLADRRRNTDAPEKSAEEAFASFKQHYLPCGPEETDAEIIASAQEGLKPRKSHRLFRSLCAMAAAVALVFCLSVTASAFGFDVWEVVARWTEDIFYFSTGDSACDADPMENDELEYASLQDALWAKGMESVQVPTWIPDGYTLTEICIDEMPRQLAVFAYYQNADKEIKIQIMRYLHSDPEKVEKSGSLEEVYQSNGVTFYIFSNYNLRKAVWMGEGFECYISGELSIDEMKTMIDSIKEG